jgi:hypothetical protein
MEMEATGIKKAVTILPSIPGLFAISSMAMEDTEIKKGCYNAALHPRALRRILY